LEIFPQNCTCKHTRYKLRNHLEVNNIPYSSDTGKVYLVKYHLKQVQQSKKTEDKSPTALLSSSTQLKRRTLFEDLVFSSVRERTEFVECPCPSLLILRQATPLQITNPSSLGTPKSTLESKRTRV
jgi:hypothetical protein